MGFKKTAEGRVFFQGHNKDTANDRATAAPEQTRMAQPSSAPSIPAASAPNQVQILALLRTLNERLKDTQEDRNTLRKELQRYRTVIEHLEEKAEKNETAFQDLEKKIGSGGSSAERRAEQAEKTLQETVKELEETRRLLMKIEERTDLADRNFSTLKKLQIEQEERLASGAQNYTELVRRLKDTEQKQEDLSGKMEESLSQQVRLMRKVDKAIEDRARFIRKIERIEETVIQTRDSLNARAMVLLTDQTIAAQKEGDADYGLSALRANPEQQPGAETEADLQQAVVSFWQKPLQISVTFVAAALTVALIAGWYISEIQKPRLDYAEISAPAESQAENELPANGVPAGEAPPPPESTAQETTQDAIPDGNLNASDLDGNGFTPRYTAQPLDSGAETSAEPLQGGAEILPPAMPEGTIDDIGMKDLNDNGSVADLLNSDADADAIAAQLNAIEPGNPEQVMADADIPPPPAPEKQEAETKPAAPAAATASSDFSVADPRLPEMIRQVEAKAFDGNAEAQHDLGAIYTAGHGGAPQDYKRAAYWFEKAANQGIPNAAYNVGVLYHQGLGLKADIKQAISWYQKAAVLGHPEAQYNLGIAYIEGIGVPYNATKAANYFESAAEKGVMEAAYNLGLIYENGLLGEAKPDTALMWYKTAADKGSPEARSALEELAKTLGIKVEDVNRVAGAMKPAKTPDKKSVAPATPEKRSDAGGQNDSRMVTAQVQEQLMKEGLYPGPADGVTGPLTSDAIRAYQSIKGLKPTGQADKALLEHMLSGNAPL